ncbi:DUF4345 domain-containing protein [Saxibacter everestensis]|uniref:DUF4345 domain-containing protein n=1 Tax=Saxibacter everestensis TaxID=2909229 RepID=A0ABY8QRA2_9MICO|nr:DUF4345 domain-containing protein [Brevibacteriaceae bacterium ZFBP1038]
MSTPPEQPEVPGPAEDHTTTTKPTRLTPRRDWLVLRIVIALVGLSLVSLGVWGAISGTAGLPGAQTAGIGTPANPTLESQFAYLSALLAGLGFAFLWVSYALDRAGVGLAALCGIIFLGGLARVIAWATAGTPHLSTVALMISELVVPPVLVLWHGSIRRTQKLKASFLREAGQ